MRPIHLLTANESAGSVRVDRFPEPQRAVHTIAIYTANFIGTVTVEATIKLNPTDDDWFVVHSETFAPFVTLEEKRRNKSANVQGCFTSMRVTVEKDPSYPFGIVDRVTVI